MCSNIANDTSLDEASRGVEIDHDTAGVPGQPPVAETIFKKIDQAGVLIADMTFVGKRIDGRPTPNPNVLIEYGWGLKSIKSERVICVMNDAFGKPTSEDLPFDLAHIRWPIRYTLSNVSTLEDIEKEKKKLVRVLEEAIRLCMSAVPLPTVISVPTFSVTDAKDGPARFRGKGELIGIHDDGFGKSEEDVILKDGPAMWLRVMPETDQHKKWTITELVENAKKSQLMPLINGAGGYSYVRASDGIGMYRASSDQLIKPNTLLVGSLAFSFRTGEIWSIETDYLNMRGDRLYSETIENIYIEGLQMYSQFLNTLGIRPPYKWKAGIVGTMKRRLGYPPPPGKQWLSEGGPVCTINQIEEEGIFQSGQSPTSSLLPFFNKIFDECGIERPKYLPNE